MLNDVFETPGKLESLLVASPRTKLPENRCLKLQEKDKLPWEPNDLLIFRGYNPYIVRAWNLHFSWFLGPKVPGNQERSFAQHPCVSLLMLKPYSICMHLVGGSCFFKIDFRNRSFRTERLSQPCYYMMFLSRQPLKKMMAGCWILEDEKHFFPALSWIPMRKKIMVYHHIPYHSCMVYLLTFGWFVW